MFSWVAKRWRLYGQPHAQLGCYGPLAELLTIVTWTIPYSKEYQKGGSDRALALFAAALAVLLLDVDSYEMGMLPEKWFMKALKFLCPGGQRIVCPGVSEQSTS